MWCVNLIIDFISFCALSFEINFFTSLTFLFPASAIQTNEAEQGRGIIISEGKTLVLQCNLTDVDLQRIQNVPKDLIALRWYVKKNILIGLISFYVFRYKDGEFLIEGIDLNKFQMFPFNSSLVIHQAQTS